MGLLKQQAAGCAVPTTYRRLWADDAYTEVVLAVGSLLWAGENGYESMENKGKILASNVRLIVGPSFSFSFTRPAGSAPDIVKVPVSAADQQRFNSVTIKQHIEDLPPGSSRDFELDVFTGVLVDIVTHEEHFSGKVDQFRIQPYIFYSDSTGNYSDRACFSIRADERGVFSKGPAFSCNERIQSGESSP
ncbi:MAG TPA: hypothetical protein VMF91_17400 [Bryobacteraceae bacterium]|nr:hypothetical protein [Bryobacteraceae bacterium]